MTELYWMCQSDNGSITGFHPLRQWSDNYIRSLEGIKDPRAPLRLHGLFSAAGLVEVEQRMIPLPLCGWSSGMSFLSDLFRQRWCMTAYCHCYCRGREADPWLSIDPKERRVGNAQQESIRKSLTTMGLYPFTKRLGLSIEVVHALVAKACIDATNPALKAYFPL